MHSPRNNLQLWKKKNQYYLSVAFRSPFQILELFNKNPVVRIGSICLLFLEIQNIVPEFLRKNGMIYCVSVLLQSVVTTVFMCSDLNSWGIFSSLTLCINCTSLSDIDNRKKGCFFSQFMKIKFWACGNVQFIFHHLPSVCFLMTTMQVWLQ